MYDKYCNFEKNNMTKILAAKLAKTTTDKFPVFSQREFDFFLPSKQMILELVELIRSMLFPGFFTQESIPISLISDNLSVISDKVYRKLAREIQRGFCFMKSVSKNNCSLDACRFDQCEEKAKNTAAMFMQALPSIQDKLMEDAEAAYEGDPAATSAEECIFSYPGIFAITNYRIAHELYLLNVPVIPRIITEYAHSLTGIDIHPGADIGKKFFIDHGTGVVIGETCIIGSGCRIYQGVTLGAKSFKNDENGNPIKGMPRHPIIEDGVIIYAGTTVLGRITIGKNSVIGGNLWITKSIPANTEVTFKKQSSL